MQHCGKILLLILAFSACFVACEKEYSYEGNNIPPVVTVPVDTSSHTDTVVTDPGALPGCSFCTSLEGELPISTWRFSTGSSSLCGEIDTAFVLNLERSTFTLFGPSYCGADSGIVFTVSLGSPGLVHDTSNFAAANAVFYYYHTNQPYVLLSHADQPFSFTITRYSAALHEVEAVFSGTGFRIDGRAVPVTNGKCRFKLL